MNNYRVVSVDRPEVPPHRISDRLRGELVYFAAPPGATDTPVVAGPEYWFHPDETAKVLEEGVFHLVSPLDTAKMTELEITEEQEALLEWLQKHKVRHVRVEE